MRMQETKTTYTAIFHRMKLTFSIYAAQTNNVYLKRFVYIRQHYKPMECTTIFRQVSKRFHSRVVQRTDHPQYLSLRQHGHTPLAVAAVAYIARFYRKD